MERIERAGAAKRRRQCASEPPFLGKITRVGPSRGVSQPRAPSDTSVLTANPREQRSRRQANLRRAAHELCLSTRNSHRGNAVTQRLYSHVKMLEPVASIAAAVHVVLTPCLALSVSLGHDLSYPLLSSLPLLRSSSRAACTMASGFGTTGQVGRCYPLWMDFSKCLADADSRSACAAFREDYLECLHHRKEVRCGPSARGKQMSQSLQLRPAWNWTLVIDCVGTVACSGVHKSPSIFCKSQHLTEHILSHRAVPTHQQHQQGTHQGGEGGGGSREGGESTSVELDAPSITSDVTQEGPLRLSGSERSRPSQVFDHKWFGTPLPEAAGHH